MQNKKGRKPDYSKGVRLWLTRAMLSLGFISSKGLYLTDVKSNTFRHTLHSMKKDNLIATASARTGGRATYLTDAVKISQLCGGGDEIGKCSEAYDRYGKVQKKKIMTDPKNAATKPGAVYQVSIEDVDDFLDSEAYAELSARGRISAMERRVRTDRERALRHNEASFMFIASGVPVLADERPSIDSIDNTHRPIAYYPSYEIRDAGPLEGKEKNKMAAGRLLGAYMLPYDIYPVYKFESHLLKYNGIDRELYAMNFIRRTFFNQNSKTEQKNYSANKSSAIFLYENDSTMAKMTIPPFTRKENESQYITTQSWLYNEMFAVPYIKESRALIRLMAKEDWRQRIIHSVLGEGHKPIRALVVHDGFKDETYELVFCVPDIKKLSAFIQIAHTYSDPSKYALYCYPWQEGFIRQLTSELYMNIIVVEDNLEELKNGN